MKIIFLNRFYWPEEPATGQLLTDLAESLAAAGHNVTVITSRARKAVLPDHEVRRGVAIHRVNATRWSRTSVAAKAVDQLSYHAGAMARLLQIGERGSVVVALTDPPLLGLVAWVVARLRGARLVHWVHDIYPEIAIQLTGHRWLAMLRPLRNLAWRRADACVTLGADMAAVLREAGVRATALHLIPNRAPEGLAPQPTPSSSPLRDEWGLAEKFVVGYSGNLGRVHELESILEVAEVLRHVDRIAFVLIGDGAQREWLEETVRSRGLPNVQFFPPQSRARLNETLGLADLHFVTLRAGCERYVFPSKFHGALAVGRPVVFIGPKDCELARIIRSQKLGGAFAPAEAVPAAHFIRSLAHDAAAMAALSAAVCAYVATHAPPGKNLPAWEAVFSGLAACDGETDASMKPQAALPENAHD